MQVMNQTKFEKYSFWYMGLGFCIPTSNDFERFYSSECAYTHPFKTINKQSSQFIEYISNIQKDVSSVNHSVDSCLYEKISCSSINTITGLTEESVLILHCIVVGRSVSKV
jgi:hypothetical protein